MITLTIKNDEVREISAGEGDGWHYKIAIKAGTYQAKVIDIGGTRELELNDKKAYWVVVTIPGTLVGGWIPVSGTNRANSIRPEELGREMNYSIQVYTWQVRRDYETEPAGEDWGWSIS